MARVARREARVLVRVLVLARLRVRVLACREARVLVLALAILALVAVPGCKKHKPPARARIWLGPTHACAQIKAGPGGQAGAGGQAGPGGQAGSDIECWGANASGQLGDRSNAGRTLPGPIALTEKVTDLALGARHTCALVGGGVRCWGDGARGQLGTGLTTSLGAASAPVVAGASALAGVTAIAAGGDRTCALTADGVRCWGDGVLEAKEPEGLHGGVSRTVSRVAVGGDGHVCAAFAEPPAVRCSGPDDHGQSAGHQALLAGATVVSLASGKGHSCVALEDGSIQCWGANESGQLGDGTTTDSRVPVLVHGLPPAAEVRAGASHTCARLRTNAVACWGANHAYQLANGTTDATGKPSPVTGLVGVQELVLAGDSACARLTDGAVRCWGANDLGQLGDGTTSPHPVPMPVKAATAPVAITK